MKVISRKNIPARSPLSFSLLMWLILDYTDAPGWVSGVVWTLVSLMWLSFFISLYREKEVDVFTGESS